MVARIPGFHPGYPGSVPGQGTKISLHATTHCCLSEIKRAPWRHLTPRPWDQNPFALSLTGRHHLLRSPCREGHLIALQAGPGLSEAILIVGKLFSLRARPKTPGEV